MAHVNLETNKIYGAKPDSLSYYHELGHIKFGKTEKGERIRLKQELSKDFLLIVFMAAFIIIDVLPLLAKAMVIIFTARWVYYYNYEEVWCWLFAFKIKKVIDGAAKV